MRQYPRLVSKGREDRRIVKDEYEEYKASTEGYESHWNPDIVKKRKGTDGEILRIDPSKPKEEIKKELKIPARRGRKPSEDVDVQNS